MRSSTDIRAEIVMRFGFIPPFFFPALNYPQILENLWQQTLSAYVENPIPALFKEKFAAMVSISCAVPYCLVCHSCTLRPLGMTSDEVLDLLETGERRSKDNIKSSMEVLTHAKPLSTWPEENSLLENAILDISTLLFLRGDESGAYLKTLRRVLDDQNFNYLSLFMAYNRTCLSWADSHPELSFEADKRAIENLKPLLNDNPRLAKFFQTYKMRFSEALQEKERYFRQLTEAIPQIVWTS